MQQKRLGNTDILVSKICLGTMTFGEQNSQEDAFAQLDYALSQGVNFIDTAEMYPVPPRKETYTKTETIIGNWLAKRGKRDDIVLASKIAGPMGNNNAEPYIRGGNDFSREQIIQACNDSLTRLQTDYLDLYQLHWPERSANYFGKLGFEQLDDKPTTPFLEIVDTLTELQKQGKIRAFGLSNETPWGMMQYLNQATDGRIAPVSIQNPYNLLNRSFEVGLSEMAINEHVPLLAYSPLAFGLLTGKYRHGAKPANARLTIFERFTRYKKPMANEAVEKYAKIADDAGISLTHLALAFVNDRAFVASNIIGATTLEQLAENIASHDVKLSEDTLDAINQVHEVISNPCP